MGLRINDTIPNLTVDTDHGTITLHDWIGDDWAILFSHPKDFTPVCTTEFGAVAQLADEWAAREHAPVPPAADGTGREIFAMMRQGASEAEAGGSAMLAAAGL